MDGDIQPPDPLLRQWHALAAGDRKGILKRLDAGQRLAFQRLLASAEREDAAVAARAQRFRACSPWLGELLDACEKDGPAAAALKPPVRAALLAGHDIAAEKGAGEEAPPSLAALAQSLLKAVRDRL